MDKKKETEGKQRNREACHLPSSLFSNSVCSAFVCSTTQQTRQKEEIWQKKYGILKKKKQKYLDKNKRVTAPCELSECV